ncbi:MAG: radical SAM protein [Gammaproteobacteria bacterium]|nr:radical SAM protein [Gammaproteobacteria bacterium]MYB39157.1 radical SAM protein [Gammaproteobacteria bacterium]
MIVDAQGRRFRNLRLSLTAACNYACTYCVPDGKRLQAAALELSASELVRAVRLLIESAGIEKLRITGGEPLLSPKFEEVLPQVMALGLADVSITTNGQLLPRKAHTVIDSGVRRINVSLDTLDPARFRAIARSGDLATVLHGIDLMLEAGLKVKVNMVPMRTANVDQVLPMLDYCLDRGIELRYIELMNMGHLQQGASFVRDFFGMEDILGLIGSRYEYARTDAAFDSTSVRFEVPGRGVFGIIANESEPFCASCTRLRLSSNGFLYGCLSSSHRHDMKDLLALPDDGARVALQRLLLAALGDKQTLSFTGEVTVMKFIGG